MTAPRRPRSFYDLGVRPALAEALAARGIVEPFPIQAASLPDSLAGRDVLGRGRTGSGKTVAFALPVLERVLAAGRRESGKPRALVLVPTRELAVQVADTVEHLAKAVKLKTMTVFGGVRYTGQLRKLERGVDVVVATPGRLEDLIDQGALRLDAVGVVVLDEADLMADMGFLPPVTRVLEAVPPGQRMLFSATLDGDVQTLVDRFLSEPLVHSMDAVESGPDADYYVLGVTRENKHEVLTELLTGGGRTLAFTRTKFGAERLAGELNAAGIKAVDLHGNLKQAARQRNLASFADGTVSVLVATDIAARGIHVDDVGLVVHVDPPNDPKAFLHRSGRTARAGSEGNVVTLATRNQNKAVRALMAQAGIKHRYQVVAPGDELIAEVRAAQVVAASAKSIFEPDPEDTIPDDELVRAPERDADRGPRRREERDRRPERRDDRRSGQGGEASGIEYRPRKEPKKYAAGPRGPRPDEPWRPERRRQDGRGERPAFDRDSRRPERRGRDRQAGEWTAEWWGPEPWQVEEQARPATRAWGRPERPEGQGRGRRERFDSRPRPGRDARRERGAEASGGERRKDRWTAEDRAKAADSRAHGFGYAKGKRGASPAGGKPRGKAGASTKDKGKPKRKPR